MLTGKVESVTFVKHIADRLDLCKINIDFDEIKVFGEYNELVGYIGMDVEYSTRQDMIGGTIETVIAHLAEIYVVQTVKEAENIKLIPEDLSYRSVMNFDISAFKYGDYESDCIAYLSSYVVGSSKKATWLDCEMVDMKSKVFSLRIFTNSLEDIDDPVEAIEALIGSYVRFNISSTQYGYQTDSMELYNVPVVIPPEVEIAVSVISNMIQGDSELMEYVSMYNFIDTLKAIIDVEPGYHLVKIATEVYLINAMSNISNQYDVKTLRRAAITSRGYLLPTKTRFSNMLLNTNKVRKTSLGRDKELLLILDVMSKEEFSPTKNIYIQINNMVNHIVNERRGLIEKTINYSDIINSIRPQFGGLL